MSVEQLEQRVAALEAVVADLRRKVDDDADGLPSVAGGRKPLGPPLEGEDLKAFEAMVEYGRYFRKTGRTAPPDWNPGDPIPEPYDVP
jgi:hypothetical protein